MNGVTKSDTQPIEPFRGLLSGQGPTAHVSMTVGFSKEYGSMKVTASVSLACDQNEKTINKAGEKAFDKALELVEDGWRELERKFSAGSLG